MIVFGMNCDHPTKTAAPAIAMRSALGTSFIRDIGPECNNLWI